MPSQLVSLLQVLFGVNCVRVKEHISESFPPKSGLFQGLMSPGFRNVLTKPTI